MTDHEAGSMSTGGWADDELTREGQSFAADVAGTNAIMEKLFGGIKTVVKPYYMQARTAWHRKFGLSEFVRIENGQIVAHVLADENGNVSEAPAEFSLMFQAPNAVMMTRYGYRRTALIPNTVRIFAGEAPETLPLFTDEPAKKPRVRKGKKETNPNA
ncbi:MAG: hypothetical protein WC734_06220 [Patescibacteria group bacterium]|jgi:hypothetical protein